MSYYLKSLSCFSFSFLRFLMIIYKEILYTLSRVYIFLFILFFFSTKIVKVKTFKHFESFNVYLINILY